MLHLSTLRQASARNIRTLTIQEGSRYRFFSVFYNARCQDTYKGDAKLHLLILSSPHPAQISQHLLSTRLPSISLLSTMKFSILSTLLLTGSAIAAPGTALRRSRAQARKSNPINRINKPELTNITEVSYSSNWAGAVLVGTGYTSVTGTFTVPSPTSAGSGVRGTIIFFLRVAHVL